MNKTARFDEAAMKASMSQILKAPPAWLGDDVLLANLVPSSFVLVEMVIRLQEEFGVRLVQEDLRTVKTVGALVQVFKERSPVVST
jgi:hypothetical protein